MYGMFPIFIIMKIRQNALILLAIDQSVIPDEKDSYSDNNTTNAVDSSLYYVIGE